MTTHEEAAATPVATIARQVALVRRRRGWTGARLAKEMTEAGVPWDRSVVANLETGRRQSVSVVEWLTLSVVLGVAPVHLLTPVAGGLYAIAPSRLEDSALVRSWIRGYEPLPGVDPQPFFSEAPLEELRGVQPLAERGTVEIVINDQTDPKLMDWLRKQICMRGQGGVS